MARIILSAQNIDIYDGDGDDLFARTGAVSAEQVCKAGAEGVILGHSEVGDTLEVVAKKLQTIIARGGEVALLDRLTILVGETWEEFESALPQEIEERVRVHLASILHDIPANYLTNLVVGYEPKWGSRGSGRDDMPPPAPEVISGVCRSLHDWLIDRFGREAGDRIPLIYGGRSTPERTEQILTDENISGLILGSACNSVVKTMEIASAMSRAKPSGQKILHANFKAYNLRDSYADYLRELKILDDTFVIYLSPCHPDLREIKALL
ncbi:MAG: triose-phosphate isomerase [Patescibacteria group bacterium]